MKKFAIILSMVAILGMAVSPAMALPKCPHTNSAGITSLNFGNCIMNVVVGIVTFGKKVKTYVCNASPAVIAVCNVVKPIAASIGAEPILNIITSILTVGCTDTESLSKLIQFVDTYNAGVQQNKVMLKGAPVTVMIDPKPLMDWGNNK